MWPYAGAVTYFNFARHSFFLVEPEFVANGIVNALHGCYEGLQKIDTSEISGEPLKSLQRIEYLFKSIGIPNYGHPELTVPRVEILSQVEKEKIVDDIDSLGLFFELHTSGRLP